MIIDKKGRLFGKVSVIDLFVVAVLAVIIVYGVLRIGNSRGIGAFEIPRPVTITFATDALGDVQAAVEGFRLDRIQISDPVDVVGSGVSWGSVEEITTEPFIDYNPNSEGIMVPSIFPDRYVLTITAKTQGYDFENGIWINGHVFLIGDTQTVSVGDTNLFITVKNIEIE